MKGKTGTYSLEYGYMHCVGRTVYTAGTVDSEEQARAWVVARSGDQAGRLRTLQDDPICRCPVRHCHLQRQLPWFSYRRT